METKFHCNHSIEQLSNEELELIQSKMYAGGMSESGFLAPSETLLDIYEKDHRYLNSVGITYKQIVDRIKTIFGKCCTQYVKEYSNTDIVENCT